MTVKAPSTAPEASSEVADAARTEAAAKPADAPDAALQALEQQRQGAKVESAAKTEELAQEVQDQVEASDDAPAGEGGAGTGSEADSDAPSKAGFFASSLSWLSTQFEGVSKFFKDTGSSFGKWLKKIMGLKEEDETVVTNEEAPEPAQPGAPAAASDSETSTEMPDEDLVTPGDATGMLEVNSWEEVEAIVDLPTRVLQAALYANATNMDCFTSDGNHCSAWCDSVFEKAGLELYNDESRIFCDGYEGWGEKGTIEGLELQPGDSIIRYNGNASTGHHQEIILDSDGPDEEGKYQILTVGQTAAKGKTGTRKVRSMTIKAEDINVVIRPGATEPFEGDGPLVA